MKTVQLLATVLSASLVLFAAVGDARAQPGRAPGGRSPVTASSPGEISGYEVSDRFTAQRRPRVTVLSFEDTNRSAIQARYGASVEAMLVTFLKRKSQFVVIERAEIKKLLEERQRLRLGQVQNEPGDDAGRELLERVDVYILGKVTLLGAVSTAVGKTQEEPEPRTDPEADTASSDGQDGSDASGPPDVQGGQIEVDAKLISRFDGRIIAAAQRSGPINCLRSIVERLGVALEQSYLRPYYGQMKFVLREPEYVRVFLTPVLLDTSLDEEKPPVELSSTVTIGVEQDTVRPWTTDSTAYTIGNLLSGWYSMRLERPGYEGMGPENSRFEARDLLGEIAVIDKATGKPPSRTDPQVGRFLVKVEPLKTGLIDGDKLGFSFRKLDGSFAPKVKRQYLDPDYSRSPTRVVLLGGKEVEINRIDPPDEYADDEKCDLFDEKKPGPPEYGRTYVAKGENFDISTYSGGELIIEDYKGEPVPVGTYQLRLWEPNYSLQKTQHTVRDGDRAKETRTALVRQTMSPILDTPSPRPAARGLLEGRDTHYRVSLPLDFPEAQEGPKFPVDVYTASTDVPGLQRWSRVIELVGAPVPPPTYDTESPEFDPRIKGGVGESPTWSDLPQITFKTRFGLGGRTESLSSRPEALAADSFIDPDIAAILDLLLPHRVEEKALRPGGFFARLFGLRFQAQAQAQAQVQAQAQALGRFGGGSAQVDAAALFGPSAQETPPTLSNSLGRPCLSDSGLRTRARSKLPCDPEALRSMLAARLESLDLLVLDARDMAGLEASRETAAVVSKWLEAGGALFAFIAGEGDYGDVAGAPLVVEALSRRSRRFELSPGDVGAVLPSLQKRVRVKSKRPLPDLSKLVPGGSWRVLAYTKPQKGPRIIERTSPESGGYALLWFDDPQSFRSESGGKVAKVEEVRRRIEEHAFKWARYVMYRRFDRSGELLRKAEDALLH